jgi:hypothetical protein
MHKVDNRNLAQKILSAIGKITNFPVLKPYGFAGPGKRSTDGAEVELHDEHCCSGGYNEAFIFEHWASFGPRH